MQGKKNGNSLLDIEKMLIQNHEDYKNGVKEYDRKRVYTTTVRFSENDLKKICFLGEHFHITSKSGVLRKLINHEFQYRINLKRK